MGEPIEMPFGGRLMSVQGTIMLDGGGSRSVESIRSREE